MHPISFRIPFTKFQKLDDGRMVIEGVATDETLDSQGDILDYEGSKKAFGDWRGNVREAHDPKKPVGKALEVAFDDAAKTIPVKVFVSKGAQDTQAKVEDGTLSCFSVGGSNPTKVKYEKVDGKQARRVLEWSMSELSLVDAGANPNATFQLVKADGVATEILAEDEVREATNRLADTLLKALKEGQAASIAKEDAPPEEEPDADDEPAKCDKCDTVHKEGVEACAKEDIAAANTARAKKGIDEAKAKHKIAQAKEDLVAAKKMLEETKGGDTEKAAEPEATKEEPKPDTTKADRAAAFKKAFEEWDIRQALEILEGLKALLFAESQEPETEPPAERVSLEGAITNVKAFIASEAAELAATQPDGTAAVAAAAQSEFLKALDERLGFIKEAIEKARPAADVPSDLFKVNHGDQMAEGIGKGLSVVTTGISGISAEVAVVKTAQSEIAKTQVELKGFLEAEFKGVRKSIDDMGKTAAVPTPMRTAPREEPSTRRSSDNGLAALEKALASTTHPETMAFLNQQIALAKAMPQG
jgi:hypothetical protein